MNTMSGHSPIWRFMVFAAAYVVALQTLLLPLTVIASDPFAVTLCSTLSADGNPSPLKSDMPCACASGCGMQCCVPALASPPSATVAIDRIQLAILAPKAIAEIPGYVSWRGSQNPRAPPLPAT